jgi:hypothetical protein
MMDGQLGSDGDSGVGTRGGRIDWRTGKRMVARDEAFWPARCGRRLITLLE